MAARERGSVGLFFDPEFAALAGTAFARSQAYSTILIALALYADLFQTSGTVEGLFGTAFAIAQLIVVLPIGRLIDLRDARKFLLGGLVLNIAVFVGFSFVGSVSHVIVLRVIQGIGASVLWVTGSAVVGEISPDGDRGLWLGTYNQVSAFSSLAGDLFGGLLLFVYGFRTTYAVLIAVTALAVVLVYRNLRANPGGRADPDEITATEAIRELLGRTTVRALVVFRMAFSFGKMAVIIFLPIYARTEFGINPFLVGGILAGGKLTKSLLQGWVGGYTDTVKRRHWFVVAGALCYALGTALIPFAEYAVGVFPGFELGALGRSISVPAAFTPLFIAYAVLGVGDSLRLPVSMALFVEEGERYDAVGGSLSLRSIAWKVGQIVGPVGVGALWDATSVFYAFWTAAGVILLATGAFVLLYNGLPRGIPTAAPGD